MPRLPPAPHGRHDGQPWKASSGQFFAQAPGQVLHILPGGASRTGTARRRPFQRFGAEEVAIPLQTEMISIAEYHGEIVVLAAAVKAEPETEAIRQRYL